MTLNTLDPFEACLDLTLHFVPAVVKMTAIPISTALTYSVIDILIAAITTVESTVLRFSRHTQTSRLGARKYRIELALANDISGRVVLIEMLWRHKRSRGLRKLLRKKKKECIHSALGLISSLPCGGLNYFGA